MRDLNVSETHVLLPYTDLDLQAASLVVTDASK